MVPLCFERLNHITKGRKTLVDVLGLLQPRPFHVRPAHALTTSEINKMQLPAGRHARQPIAPYGKNGQRHMAATATLIHIMTGCRPIDRGTLNVRKRLLGTLDAMQLQRE